MQKVTDSPSAHLIDRIFIQCVPSNEDANLRSNIVEILSGTANGCLTELGYYPGMPQNMVNLEQQNAQWQLENVKLFQDNRSLSHALQSEQAAHANTTRKLEGQIQGLISEKIRLSKHNEALMSALDAPNQKVLSEYFKLQSFYESALIEIKQLRDYITQISVGQHSRQQAQPLQITEGQSKRIPISQNGQSSQPAQNPPLQISRPSQRSSQMLQASSSSLLPHQPAVNMTGKKNPNYAF